MCEKLVNLKHRVKAVDYRYETLPGTVLMVILRTNV